MEYVVRDNIRTLVRNEDCKSLESLYLDFGVIIWIGKNYVRYITLDMLLIIYDEIKCYLSQLISRSPL